MFTWIWSKLSFSCGLVGTVSDSVVGLAMSQSLVLTAMVPNGIRQMADTISQITCVERILEYSEMSKEHATEISEGMVTRN